MQTEEEIKIEYQKYRDDFIIYGRGYLYLDDKTVRHVPIEEGDKVRKESK